MKFQRNISCSSSHAMQVAGIMGCYSAIVHNLQLLLQINRIFFSAVFHIATIAICMDHGHLPLLLQHSPHLQRTTKNSMNQSFIGWSLQEVK